jgi:hypothetical protein
MLYAHVQAASLIFLSWYSQDRGKYLLADICGAAAVSFEFPVLVLWVIILCYRGRGYWRSATAARAAGILVLFMLPQMVCNRIAFGSPFTMGYSLEVEESFSGIREGLFGFTVPSIGTFYMIALSPERGLFFYMPWAVPALAGLWGRGGIRKALGEGPGIPLVVAWLLLFSAQYARASGWAFGPRYLIPVIPFLAWGLARFASRSPRHAFTSLVLLLPSMLMCLLGTFGEPHQPVHPFERPLPLPQLSIGLRMLLDGHHSVWLLGAAGTLAVSLGLIAIWAARFRGTRPCLPAAAVLVPWLALGILSSRADWGGKIDYYRGLLAQHRHEYDLAASYYLSALEDPTAPAAVRENYDYCHEMADTPGERAD